MPLDPQRTLNELKELRVLTEDANGAQRVAWTDLWIATRAWFETKLAGLPVEYHFDAAGNRWITLPGDSPKALILGSHLDSVPNGGWLDGALGVMAGLEILRRFSEQYKGRPPVTIRLVDFADEEGARFGRSLLGSSAVARCGFPLHGFPEAAAELKDAAAYLELHIEQGPVLETLGIPLGVVLGTKGVERHAITFHGQEAHSGSTPMNARHDALAAAAKLALEIRTIARRHPDAVCTMGSVKTFPGIVTAVVGRCETTLDQRDLDAGILAQMYAEAQEASRRFAAEEGCTVEWSRIWSIEPVPFHPDLIEMAGQAIEEISGSRHLLPSGPLHDAAEISRAGIPTVMMFVQSLRGISHNKIEDTREDHLIQAIRALDRLADKTVAGILRS